MKYELVSRYQLAVVVAIGSFFNMPGIFSLVLDALDEFNHVNDLQELLKISINLEPEKTKFLVEAYLQLSETHFNQCFVSLERVEKTLNDDFVLED